MGLVHKKKRVSKLVLESATCDKCKCDIPVHESGSFEGILIRHTGGYYGGYDMQSFTTLFCDDCAFEVVGQYGKINNEWGEE